MTTNGRSAQGPDALTIGDLAARTGLSPAVLRTWETRHGFPAPTRLGSGHRRYAERDVALVQQVLRRQHAGVRLEAAIAEAAATVAPTPSVYAGMRRADPGLVPQRLRKSTLLALTTAIEDECCARAEHPLLYAGFQHQRHYRAAQARWAELSRTAERATVFAAGFDDNAASQAKRLRLVPLPGPAPMRREWFLVCDSPDYPAALAAWELPGQEVADRRRVFETVWTLDPPAVRAAAIDCERLAADYTGGGDGELLRERRPPAPASSDLRSATGLFSRMAGYMDHSAR